MAHRIITILLLLAASVLSYPLAVEAVNVFGALLYNSGPSAWLRPGARNIPAGPGAWWLSTGALVATSLLLRGSAARVASASTRQALIGAIVLAFGATATWVAVQFFGGALAEVGSWLPLALLASFAALLMCVHVFSRLAPAEATAFVAAMLILWLGLFGAPGRDVVVLVFVLAFALAYWLVIVRTRVGGLRRLLAFAAMVVAAHLLWITSLFLIDVVALPPRWLVLATAATFVAGATAFHILIAARSGGHGLYNPDLAKLPNAWPELIQPTETASPADARRAWIISYTGVSNEPRVLRQCEALIADGWSVVVCGFDGHSPRPKQWTFVRLPSTEPFSASVHGALVLVRKLARFLLVRCGVETAAHVVHGTTPLWLHTRRELVRLARKHPELKPALVVSHDWHCADVGAAVAAVYGAKFSVDVHEYAAGQYSYDPEWVKWDRPVTVGVQGTYLRRADVVTVVCRGIGELIAAENRLSRQPVVIRSVPFKNAQPFRPTGEKIEVLYHGDLSRRREIHAAIASLPSWRPEFYLRLRGSGDTAYVDELKAQIEALGLQDRVVFEPSVPFDQIVPAANRADIGFFSFDGDSPQIRYTLPNKLFEYVMAGICLCVGDTPEVNRIVTQYGNGRLIGKHSPQAIAEAINSLDRETIDACKKASIAAAEELNWPAEKVRLLQAYREIL